MKFSEKIKNIIQERHLLKHPFYQDWMEGRLSLNQLRNYACQYYWHVAAFPRYLSATHSLCDSIEERRLLLENLVDEEGLKEGCEDHPELWLRFVEGLGVSRKQLFSLKEMQPQAAIRSLIHGFMLSSKTSYPEGLAALYTYESQVPEVAESKIEGLKKHYSIDEKRTLSFFSVHKEADKVHREVCERQLDRLTEDNQVSLPQVVRKILRLLWNFLSDMHASRVQIGDVFSTGIKV